MEDFYRSPFGKIPMHIKTKFKLQTLTTHTPLVKEVEVHPLDSMKTKGQQLKGKIVSALLSHFLALFHTFSHFFKVFQNFSSKTFS